MSGVNKFIGVGNVCADPEIKTLESGVKIASFSIACNESYKDRDGNKVENVEFVNIVLWRGVAEVAEKYIKKGDKIYIEGKLQTRSWEDESGNKRYATEIVGNNLTMLGGKKKEEPNY